MPRLFVPLAAVALLLTGCGDRNSADTAGDVAARTDSVTTSMGGDSVAPVEVIPPAPVVEAPVVAERTPAPRPSPARTAPRRTAPTPAPAPSAPAASSPRVTTGTVAAGTTIGVTSGGKVCSNTLSVGDRITATTNSAIDASNGVSIPAGARVGLVVTTSKTSSGQGSSSDLAFDVRSLTYGGETYDVSGTVGTEAVVQERKGGDAKKVAIGAAAGAVIGNVIGGGSRAQRTVVGAAAGGLAGAAAAAATGDRLACLPEGSALTVRLSNSLTVRN
ncbi:MAG TPA: hypothetical protein VE861_14965 [Gemmatimonadaceae bacterium]|nr:hypothetical protein [Gemmatimonadaceae bacterium]